MTTAAKYEYRVRQHPTVPDQFLVLWREKSQSQWLHIRTVVNLRRASDVMAAHRRWWNIVLRRPGHGGS